MPVPPSSEPRPPRDVDLTRAAAARVYDFFLDGTSNWAVDRQAGQRALALLPEVKEIARANRAFLRRAVHHCVAAGIDQFVDIGSGVPTVGSVHEVAGELAPDARVVYVDNEPVTIAYGRIELDEHGDPHRHSMLQADLCDGEYLWKGVLDTGVLDPTRPVALLALTVLHYVPDAEGPHEAMDYYRDQLPPGSALVLSHATRDHAGDRHAALDAFTRVFDATQNPLLWRDYAEIAAFLGDFVPVDPGLVYVPDWRPDPAIAPELSAEFTASCESLLYGCLARKPF